MADFWILVTLGVLGVVMGSAVTALAYRVPREISWVHGRSACPACQTRLGVFDLVPLVSFLASGGRCRHCRAPIPLRYPIIELSCAAWAILLYRQHGPGFDYPFLAVWGFLLIALMWIDFEFQLLPDALTFPGALIAMAAVLQWPSGARHAIFGVLVGSGLLWFIAWAYWKVRKVEGMGGGDVKLAAMFGIVLGWKLTLLTLFLAALAGSLWGAFLIVRRMGDGRTALPFGTLLAPSAMIAFLWGERWMDAYLSTLVRH